jgi:hypothetical protein
MTPKEKAIELVNKFIGYSYFSDGNNSMNIQYQQEYNAKQCALIAVDEIIKVCPYISSKNKQTIDEFNSPYYAFADYWQEVKSEIETL